jgi:metal-sulfur cluster biosynthetic enzyme
MPDCDTPVLDPTQPIGPTAVTADEVRAVLEDVMDPELGLDVMALGLVYGVEVDGTTVRVTMTLTTPGCPLHDTITDDARRRVGALDGVDAVDVALVWEPAWTPAAMSASARRALGWG